MYYSSAILITSILIVCGGERDLFVKKCKRECNTEHGSIDCWEKTTDGFAYGLATTMVDYCQVILELRQMSTDKVSWYNISRDIIVDQVNKFKILKPKARPLSKTTIIQIATSLLNKCFNADPSVTSYQPFCLSCSTKDNKLMKQWRIMSIILISTGFLFFVIILILYTLHTKHTRLSYESIS